MRYYIFLFTFISIALIGCDAITDNQSSHSATNGIESTGLFGDHNKVLTQGEIDARNASCSINPTSTSCVRWCADPLSNCDGTSVPVLPTAGFSFSVDGLSVQFTDSSQNAISYEWNFGDTVIDVSQNPLHIYALDGTYDVTLTVTNTDGTDTVIQSISISTPVPTPVSGPDDIPSDRIDIGGGGWFNDIPDPASGTVVFTGYSNSSGSARTFLDQYAGTYTNFSFVNCAQSGSALENWVLLNLAATCVADNVTVTVNMIATQSAQSVEEAEAIIKEQLLELITQLKAAFPDAIHLFYGGEPAHFVADSRCPGKCEPIRKLSSDWSGEVADGIDGAYRGPYLWAGLGTPNDHGFVYVIEDFANPQPDGTANQHQSQSGKNKVAEQYDIFFRENGMN